MKKHRKIFMAIFLLASVIFASDHEQEKSISLRASGVPAISFDSDRGMGGGLVGSLYFDEPGFSPFKMALDAQIFLTTEGVHSHYLSFDWLKPFGYSWRLITKLGFYSTVAQNYCGKASDAKCDEQRSANEANILNLKGDQKTEYMNKFYQNRFISMYGGIYSRFLLWKDIARLEFMASYRGRYYLNRDFSESGPYRDSLFAKDFGAQKIDGYLSTAEIGLMLDRRDNEPAPTSGYWLEASTRASSFVIASAWDAVGLNMAARFYLPIDDKHKLVLASQSIADLIFGDLPFDALSKIGGSQSLQDYAAIGGQYIGRGIRDQLYVGRVKALQQLEMRYTFWSFSLLRQNFDLTSVILGDLGFTAWDLQRFSKDMKPPHLGFGTGFRIHWNKTFILRADMAMSPEENFSPRIYVVVGNIF